jgi:site-specific recombinase XerD
MTLDRHLAEKGLLPNTRKTYGHLAAQAGDDPVAWLKGLVAERRPMGTLAPARAAVRHKLENEGKSEEEVRALLPRIRGRKGKTREALSPDDLAAYYEAVEAEASEPIRTILLLLPRSGLRITEACRLRRENVTERSGRLVLRFRGKGDKERVVPLGTAGSALLRTFMESNVAGADYLFPGRGGPITDAAVRRVTRLIRERHDVAADLSPHVLRHTYATSLLSEGVDVRSLQALLGHESASTTMRYLHPSTDDLTRAVDKLGGL